jgi:hypothetical protein
LSVALLFTGFPCAQISVCLTLIGDTGFDRFLLLLANKLAEQGLEFQRLLDVRSVVEW